MKDCFAEQPNGYQESISDGLNAVMSLGRNISDGKGTPEERVCRLRKELDEADAVVIGAGAGLSAAAGLTYSGSRFERYFFDFAGAYGISDMYSGGFYPFPTEEIRWAWWARHIYFNRYADPPKPVYRDLLELLRGRDFFVVTTNVDHQFQRAGFDKERLFYTQGDYGLFQSTDPGNRKTYDNEIWVIKAMEAQGFVPDGQGVFDVPGDRGIKMEIPSGLIPKCPDDGSDVTMNLRSDETFVEDEGWHAASAAYSRYLRAHRNGHVLYLELGVGANTPVIIKYPFWHMVSENRSSVYACINHGEAFCPKRIESRSICIDGDIADILCRL